MFTQRCLVIYCLVEVPFFLYFYIAIEVPFETGYFRHQNGCHLIRVLFRPNNPTFGKEKVEWFKNLSCTKGVYRLQATFANCKLPFVEEMKSVEKLKKTKCIARRKRRKLLSPATAGSQQTHY